MIYLLLNSLVIKKTYTTLEDNTSLISNIESGQITSSDKSYEDDNIKIAINTYREYDTDIYVADVTVNNPLLLKTALANNSYGRNITDSTSNIADSVNAILAINGDYYGVQEYGYVFRNGTIYRDTSKNNQEDLVIYEDGTFEIINEGETSIETLKQNGAYNILSFGPALLIDNNISVDENDEVGKAMASNPRTAIGIIDNNHYVFVVSDGRTDESAGLSLYQLATFMKSLNCDIAYNLDGGGSSTMVFNGNVINNPTNTGRHSSERKVSDIVYIGY